MNRGVLQNSPVQQMMAAGNPSWWPNINNLMRPPILSSHHQQPLLSSPPSSFLAPPHNNNNNNNDNNNNVFQADHYNMNMPTAAPSSSSWLDDHSNNHQEQHHQLPESWRQLLFGGVFSEEEAKKMETSWEEQVVLQQQAHHPHLVDVKQESSSVNSYINNNHNNNVYSDQEFQLAAAKAAAAATNWSHHHPQLNNIPVSSPQSCVTSFSTSSNLLDFSSISSDNLHCRQPPPGPDRSSECITTATGGATKKAKVQPSPTPSTAFKVRKEKLGDRITALHQLVSPFGKTDTASVLLEAIGYIRFLQSQIEALSLPYLNTGAGNMRQPHHNQGEKKCIFPEDPGQLLNDNCLKRKGGPDQDSYEEPKDLRSRGLCLVPVSCTLHVGSDNGADYWAPALGGGFR